LDVLERADLILHVGDFTAACVLEELKSRAPVEAVHGNMDEPELKNLLPERLVVAAEDVRFGLVHDGGPAAGRPERLAALFPGCRVVAYGHSHFPEVTHVGATWIVNPGSPSERRRAPFHSFVVVADGKPQLVRLD
jgi:putative phosphoesterase